MLLLWGQMSYCICKKYAVLITTLSWQQQLSQWYRWYTITYLYLVTEIHFTNLDMMLFKQTEYLQRGMLQIHYFQTVFILESMTKQKQHSLGYRYALTYCSLSNKLTLKNIV